MSFEKRLVINLPEGIALSMPIADPISRGLALILDAFIKGMACATFYILMVLLSGWDVNIAVCSIGVFVVLVFYQIIFETLWQGQTPGKRMLKLRVVDANGLRLTFSQIVVRNLLRIINLLPFGYIVGGSCALFSAKGQRLGDIAAGTTVISQRVVHMPDLELLKPEKYNSLRDYAYISARLRQLTAPEEALLIANAILRRNELDPAARLKVFKALRDYFETKANYPEELTHGMSDEQYLRNIADICFQ
jgi:uncharacterized RDD family membrane protein YckC